MKIILITLIKYINYLFKKCFQLFDQKKFLFKHFLTNTHFNRSCFKVFHNNSFKIIGKLKTINLNFCSLSQVSPEAKKKNNLTINST